MNQILSLLRNLVNVTDVQTILSHLIENDLKIIAFIKDDNGICFIDQYKKILRLAKNT